MKATRTVQQRSSKRTNRRQSGFTLVTALFLLIVVALLSVYIINLRNVQQSTVVFGQQGARAMQAARTGLEWAIYDSVVNGNCTGGGFNAGGTALATFNITVTCSVTTHTEALIPINTYVLTSTAQTGAYGTLDYVFRQLRVTVSDQPP